LATRNGLAAKLIVSLSYGWPRELHSASGREQESLPQQLNGQPQSPQMSSHKHEGPGAPVAPRSPGSPRFPATFVMHNCLHLVSQRLRAAFSQKVISGLCTRVAFWLTAWRPGPPNPNPLTEPLCRSDIFIGLPIS